MADKKISQLTTATTPLAGTEEIPLVQSNSTKKVSIDNLTAGKAVTALSLTATNVKTSSATSNLNISGNTIAADGTDINIGINITPKGTGAVKINGANGQVNSVLFADLVVVGGASNAGTSKYVFDAGGGNTNSAAVITHYANRWSGPNSELGISVNNGFGLQEAFLVKTAGDVALPVGNLVVGTAGKGIDFSANTHAAGMTSELLNWYEEGTFTFTDASGAGLTITSNGFYTRIGRLVHWQAIVVYPSTASGADSLLGGLPFTPVGGAGSQGRAGAFISATDKADLVNVLQIEGTAQLQLFKAGFVRATNAELSSGTIYFAGFFVV